jgi:hypothetical protein
VDEKRIAELQARAAELRRMAATATTEDVRDALLRLAARIEALVASVDQDGRRGPLLGAYMTRP